MERGLTPFGSDRRDACPTYNDESPPSYLLQETKKVISPWVRTVGVEEVGGCGRVSIGRQRTDLFPPTLLSAKRGLRNSDKE